MKQRKVNYVRLHTEFFVIGLGPSTTVIDNTGSVPPTKYRELTMVTGEIGIECRARNAQNQTFEFVLPYSNIVGFNLVQE